MRSLKASIQSLDVPETDFGNISRSPQLGVFDFRAFLNLAMLVPTPLGSYNPDWAVLVTAPDGDRLYFVVETKSSLFGTDLRNAEAAKIECGRAHFKALAVGDNPAIYDKFVDVAGLLERAQTLA